MKVIAVDIDEVLARHNHALALFHNQRHGTNHTEQDYFSDYWSEVWQVSQDEAERRAVEFHEAGIHATLEPLPDAYDTLKFLREQFDLHVVTVRRQSVIALTTPWIEKYFPNIFSEVHFIHFWDKGEKQTKASVCQRIGAGWLIDDGVKHVVKMADCQREGLLFGDYPWNQSSTLPSGMTRVKNWQEVRRYFHG